MGKIVADVDLENVGDRALAQARHLPEANVRRTRVKAVADTGAVMLALPEDIVERLGVPVVGSIACVPAGGRRRERPVPGPVTVRVGDRSMPANCVVVPAGAHAVIGRVILAQLDLVADRVNQKLGPQPESPDRPLVRLRGAPCADGTLGVLREPPASRSRPGDGMVGGDPGSARVRQEAA